MDFELDGVMTQAFSLDSGGMGIQAAPYPGGTSSLGDQNRTDPDGPLCSRRKVGVPVVGVPLDSM